MVGLVGLASCVATGYNAREHVTEMARDFSNRVRWGSFEQASHHIKQEDRQRFVDRHKRLEDELEIADYELLGLDVDAKREHALVRVEYTWSMKRRGLVEKTTTEQHWDRIGSDWLITAEVRTRGSELPLFDEPPTANKKDEATPTNPTK